MTALIVGAVVYLILGVYYVINYFHNQYKSIVEDQCVGVGEFFGMTILVGLLWPMLIVIVAKLFYAICAKTLDILAREREKGDAE